MFRFVYWILRELHTTLVITMNHGGIQHFPKQSCKELLKPHCFVSWHRYCNILGLCGTQSHRSLLHATLGNHGRLQTKATPRGALLVPCAPCPIRIIISLQSHINTRSISQAISNCASQVSQHMLRSYPMHMFRPGLPKRPPPPPVRTLEARSERERPRTALPPALRPSRTALPSSNSRSLPLPEPPRSRSLPERSRPCSLTYKTRSRSLGTALLERSQTHSGAPRK
jgi:hypothetical protein